jgi:hypothetical protein
MAFLSPGCLVALDTQGINDRGFVALVNVSARVSLLDLNVEYTEGELSLVSCL